MIDRQRALHWVMLFGGAAALGALAWQLRPWVPPATLWVQEATITAAVDKERREPGSALVSVAPAQVHAQGLYAFISIHAPRGLHEQVWHRWVQNGQEVDRIALDIFGGRAEGYRAWSYKRSFPADPRGQWRVEAITDGGQLIGRIEFSVSGELPRSVSPQPVPQTEAPVEPPVETPAEPPAEPPAELPAEPVPEQEPAPEVEAEPT